MWLVWCRRRVAYLNRFKSTLNTNGFGTFNDYLWGRTSDPVSVDPSQIDRWWEEEGTTTGAGALPIFAVAVAAIVVAVIVVTLVLLRKRPQSERLQPMPPPPPPPT